MSPVSTEMHLLATAIVVAIIFALYRLVRWTKKRSPNTELWGTIFESLTHHVQPQGPLKEPKQEISKIKRQSGDDEDGVDKSERSG